MKTITSILIVIALLGATPAAADWYDTSKRPDLWSR